MSETDDKIKELERRVVELEKRPVVYNFPAKDTGTALNRCFGCGGPLHGDMACPIWTVKQ